MMGESYNLIPWAKQGHTYSRAIWPNFQIEENKGLYIYVYTWNISINNQDWCKEKLGSKPIVIAQQYGNMPLVGVWTQKGPSEEFSSSKVVTGNLGNDEKTVILWGNQQIRSQNLFQPMFASILTGKGSPQSTEW